MRIDMIRHISVAFALSLLFAASAAAELRHVEMKTLGMD
jgi:hypothetical protein